MMHSLREIGVGRLSFRRRKYKKEPKKRVLIVTEGEKTEPNYFKDLKNTIRLSTVEIVVTPSDFGTDPLSVVDYAISLRKDNLRDNKRNGEPRYDLVYCVFDRDTHETYLAAYDKGNANKLITIRSIPCFEIWIMLHCRYSSRPYSNYDELLPDLKALLPDYSKGNSLSGDLMGKYRDAILHAERLYKSHSEICDIQRSHPNPFTEVHLLVNDLIAINE